MCLSRFRLTSTNHRTFSCILQFAKSKSKLKSDFFSKLKPEPKTRPGFSAGAGFTVALIGIRPLIPEARRKTKPAADRTRVSPEDRRGQGQGQGQLFDWPQLLRLLWPHIWYLLAAAASALAVAALNIEIPRMLGSLVNVVSEVALNAGGNGIPARDAEEFYSAFREPAAKMVKLYLAQGLLTFGYIYSLSCVGEKVAAEMRKNLFASVIKQDIAFFDSHKSGEIVARLTADVQDFKSKVTFSTVHFFRTLFV